MSLFFHAVGTGVKATSEELGRRKKKTDLVDVGERRSSDVSLWICGDVELGCIGRALNACTFLGAAKT